MEKLYYCIFEVNNDLGSYKFVSDYPDFELASLMCESFNNFRTGDMSSIVFKVRCLDQSEFDNISSYNPFATSIHCVKCS